MTVALLVVTSVVYVGVDGGAQVPEAPSVRATRLPSSAERPMIDGRLDDVVWELAEVATGFRQREPRERGVVATVTYLIRM